MRGAPANLRVRRTSQYTVVEMLGEIDASNSDGVGERLLEVLNDGTAPVIIDLTDTLFFDSTALKALVRARTHALAGQGRLSAVIPPSGPVRRIFELTGISRLIPVHDDLDSAIAVAAIDGDQPIRPTVTPSPGHE